MKKNLLLILAATLASVISAQTNLLQNSDFETQGAWQVKQCDPKGSFEVNFGETVFDFNGGSGKVVNLFLSATPSAQVFIYQPVVVKPGHTYKFSGAMKDLSDDLNNMWIGLSYTFAEPQDTVDITETSGSSFGSWDPCNGKEFNGLIDTSCAVTSMKGNATPKPYIHISDTLKNDTVIYFGINVGTWGAAEIDLYFDNLMLVDSAEVPSSVKSLTTEMSLSNYPNPFNLTTTVSYTINISGKVELDVYNLQGAKVASLVNGYKPAGSYTASFDGSMLSGGVYFYSLKVDGLTTSRKMTLIK